MVIDYKPLNQYLQDVKFPLPNKRALLQHLQGAKLFSKFDLKSGFWQLGVHPEERYKTAFCLPNRHLQWNVLPFGLKTAPSLFQQAMLRIFEPLLHTALIYIDDILIFSKNEEEHIQALQQLLRWSEWFSKYDFESVYLKGTKNTLADMLSRKPVKQETPYEISSIISSIVCP